MRQILPLAARFFSCFLGIVAWQPGQSQSVVCNKDTAFYINFGAGNSRDFSLSFLRNYRHEKNYCPQDGYYTFTPYTSDCFGGNWITVPEDHTPGDLNGKMMLVNASWEPGEFFLIKVSGLRANTLYELSAWLLNVCQRTVGCRTLHPDIDFIIMTMDGKLIARFGTGELPADKAPIWKRYAYSFKLPAGSGDVIIKMVNKENGGCGNDFALDDIVLTPCMIIEPKPIREQSKLVDKPIEKPKPATPRVEKKDRQLTTVSARKETTPVIKPIARDSIKLIRPEPVLLQTRSNPVVKQIFTDSAELLIEVYDNGVIDGDTISIYHNKDLIVENVCLSGKPIRFKVKCNTRYPHHELVMVANNLGSIPPNTSLMIVTAKDERHEVFISSDDKKNARVVIDLKPGSK